MADPDDERARRVRALLSSYYGSSSGGSSGGVEGGGGGRAGGSGSVPAIDTAAFDAEKYVERLVQTTRLDALQGKCVEMASEIKSLDSDMQMLVYENYSKFITATDTIRRMKSNVEGMEERMAELQATIASTSARSDAVNSKLGAHREQIEQLHGVRNLIKKLQAVFDLPQRLRTCIDRNAIALAVRYYARAAPLLDKYGEEGAFVGVKEEAEEAVVEITAKLKAGMAAAADARKRRLAARAARAAGDDEEDVDAADGFPADDLGLDMPECVELLEQLGTPQGELQNDFLHSRRVALEPSLAKAEACVGTAVDDPKAFVVDLNRGFLEDFHSTASEYLELFPQERAPLVAAARDLFGRYFKIVKAALSASNGGGLIPAKGLMAALATMAADLSGIHRMLPESALGDRAAEVVERAVRSRVGTAFHNLEATLADRLNAAAEVIAAAPPSAASSDASPLLLRQFVALSDALLSGIGDVLADVRALLEERPVLVASWRGEFEGMIRGHATSLLHALLARLRVAAGRKTGPETQLMFSPDSPLAPPAPRQRGGDGVCDGSTAASFSSTAAWPTPLLLVHARLAHFLETDGVPHIARELESFFPGSSGDGGSGGAMGGAFDAEECLRMSEAAATALVSAYVEASGRRLSLMVRKSIFTPNWLDMKEPRDVRPLADFLLDDLAAIEAETAQILEDGGHGQGVEDAGVDGSSGAPLSPVTAQGSKKIERGVANVFQGKPQIFAPVEATQASVLTGVVRIALKSMAECVRCQTLGRAGYHQLTLDIAYLKLKVRRFASADTGNRTVDLLLEEAASVAADRSLDPVPMEPAIVQRILDAKLAKQRAEQ